MFEETSTVAIRFIAKYLIDKRVYEVGAGGGDFAKAILPLASRVKAIECDHELAQQCRAKGLETLEMDYMNADYADADVIFCFLNPVGMWALGRKLHAQRWHGILLSHTWTLKNLQMMDVMPKEVIEVIDYDVHFPILVYKL